MDRLLNRAITPLYLCCVGCPIRVSDMRITVIFGLLAMAFPAISPGQGQTSYQCSFGELQRRVEILTEPGVSVPCEVHYYKDTEAPGDKQVLWSAGSQEGFCESKTEEFVAKLEGWGWDCGQGGEAAPATEPEVEPEVEAEAEAMPEADAAEGADEAPPVYDDTDVLSPGNPTG